MLAGRMPYSWHGGKMKKMEAIVRNEKFEEMCQVLEDSGIGGITVAEAPGSGHHRNGPCPKIKIDVYCDEFWIDKVVDIVR